MPTDSEKFASMVGALRSSGMTLRALGKQCGLSPATLQRIERGEARQPSYGTVKAIERVWEKAGKPEPK